MMISNKVILHILYRNYKIFIKDIFSYLIIQTLNVHTDREFDNHDEQHLKLCIGKQTFLIPNLSKSSDKVAAFHFGADYKYN